MLNITSKLEIETGGDSFIILPNDLFVVTGQFEYPAYSENSLIIEAYNRFTETVAGVRSGQYHLSRSGFFYKFIKLRGEVCFNNGWHHVEIICTKAHGQFDPIIIRMWRLSDMQCAEYLIQHSATVMQSALFGKCGGGLFLDVAIILSEVSGTTDNIWFDRAIDLMPNRDSKWYSDNALAVVGLVNCQNEEHMFNAIISQFFDGIDCVNLSLLISQLNGASKINVGQVSVTPCTVSQYDTSAAEITSTAEYFAIQAFSLIPYDHFSLFYENATERLMLELVDCMAGVNTPFMNSSVSIEASLNLAVENLIEAYKPKFPQITYIEIHRTMDEILNINIVQDDFVTTMSFDLILLALISPASGLT